MTPAEPLRPGDSNGGACGFAFGILLGGASGLPGMGGRDGLGSVLGAHDVAEARLVAGEENIEGKPGLVSPKRSLGDALETRLPPLGG